MNGDRVAHSPYHGNLKFFSLVRRERSTNPSALSVHLCETRGRPGNADHIAGPDVHRARLRASPIARRVGRDSRAGQKEILQGRGGRRGGILKVLPRSSANFVSI